MVATAVTVVAVTGMAVVVVVEMIRPLLAVAGVVVVGPVGRTRGGGVVRAGPRRVCDTSLRRLGWAQARRR